MFCLRLGAPSNIDVINSKSLETMDMTTLEAFGHVIGYLAMSNKGFHLDLALPMLKVPLIGDLPATLPCTRSKGQSHQRHRDHDSS